MADLTRNDVLNLAKLARLQLSDEEIGRFQKEISAILKYVEQLQEVDLNNTEPTYQVTGLTDVMRPDEEINYGVSAKELLKNAPATEAGQIKVRKVL